MLISVYTQQTRGIGTMLDWCWASVVDDEPALDQQWANASCMLGTQSNLNVCPILVKICLYLVNISFIFLKVDLSMLFERPLMMLSCDILLVSVVARDHVDIFIVML